MSRRKALVIHKASFNLLPDGSKGGDTDHHVHRAGEQYEVPMPAVVAAARKP
jgi:hypothetical protein